MRRAHNAPRLLEEGTSRQVVFQGGVRTSLCSYHHMSIPRFRTSNKLLIWVQAFAASWESTNRERLVA